MNVRMFVNIFPTKLPACNSNVFIEVERWYGIVKSSINKSKFIHLNMRQTFLTKFVFTL